MKLKSIVNGSILFIGLGLTGYAWLNGYRVRFNVEEVAIDELSEPQEQGQQLEEWQLKPGSVYDGDTLRVVRGNEELKIRFCGIDAPEKKMPMGVESRDHLRSLVDIGKGQILLLPIEQDRYKRTVAELYVKDSRSTVINLNVQMVRDGYAWHYEQYSGNCSMRDEFAIAQKMAQDEGLGIWNGNPQPPWEWRKSNK